MTHEIMELIRDPRFFRDLNPLKNSQDVIKELNKHFEVYITTAAMEFPTSFTAKYEWLAEHFDFLNEHFKGQGILFTAPHNVNEDGYVRVNNWLEARDYFLNHGII